MLKKNFLKILISISVLFLIVNFYFFVYEKSLNQYADWLINYQGGFIRRGLVGEIFYQLFKITHIRLDIIIFLFVSLFYIIFSINFFNISKKIELNFTNLLIIFSPFSFLYPVINEKASGRKDIIFLLILSYICLYLEKIKFKYQKYIIIFLSIISILTHTGFLFLIPFFLTFFIIINSHRKIKILIIELFYIAFSISLVSFIIFKNSSINSTSIELICNSLGNYVRADCSSTGYISTLNWSLNYNLELKEKLWTPQNYNLFYFKYFVVSFLPLFYVLFFSKFNKLKINVLILFLLNLVAVLPLFYIGVDYGRYLYLSYLSLLIIYFSCLNSKKITTNIPKYKFLKNIRLKSQVIFVIIFLYGFTFTIPHCCDNKVKFIYSKLISQIIEKN